MGDWCGAKAGLVGENAASNTLLDGGHQGNAKGTAQGSFRAESTLENHGEDLANSADVGEHNTQAADNVDGRHDGNHSLSHGTNTLDATKQSQRNDESDNAANHDAGCRNHLTKHSKGGSRGIAAESIDGIVDGTGNGIDLGHVADAEGCQSAPERCPSCGGPMKTIGTGTQKVQEELEFLFPDWENLRMDTDTVNAVNTHEKILDTFQKEKIPVLIGTQMVAKGLNLPDVTLVGVLDGDLSLYTGGYRAGETTFNMLTQVVGRAGRGAADGRALIQTLVPEHQVIRLAARQDYDGFYDLEINLRRVQNAPPFGDLAVITVTGQDETAVLRGAAKFRDSLNACLRNPAYKEETCTVLGPAPCAVPKINYHFRYQLTLRCRMTRNLRLLLAYLLREFSKDKANRGINAYIDVNGYD